MVMMMTCVCVCIHGQAYLIYIVWNCYKYLIATRRVLPSVTRNPSDVGHRRTPSQPLSPIQSVTATVNAATSTAPDTQVLSILPLLSASMAEQLHYLPWTAEAPGFES